MFEDCFYEFELRPKSYRQIKELKRKERLILDINRSYDCIIERAIDFYCCQRMQQLDCTEGVFLDEC